MTVSGERLSLALLATALAALSGIELLAPGPAAMSLRHHRIVLPPTPAPISTSSQKSEADPGTILARPLFRPDRRPPSVKTATTRSTPLPRLSGILIGNGFRLAMFAAKSGKTHIAATGTRIDGYRIVRIGPASITLDGPRGRISLTPRFTKTSDAPPNAASHDSHPRYRPKAGAPERR